MFRLLLYIVGFRVVRFLPSLGLSFLFYNYDLYFLVHSYNIVDLIMFLSFSTFFLLNVLVDCTAIDFFNRLDLKNVRFEINYCLLSVLYTFRIFCKICIKDLFIVESLSMRFDNILIFEREIFDLFGILFYTYCGSFFRILLDYGFAGCPLRKDFPVCGLKEIAYSVFSNFSNYISFIYVRFTVNLINNFEKLESGWFSFE